MKMNIAMFNPETCCDEDSKTRRCSCAQVREQQRSIALSIRRAVEQRREQELEQLGKELREEWEREQRQKVDTLQRRYQESLQLLGQAQRSAKENVTVLVFPHVVKVGAANCMAIISAALYPFVKGTRLGRHSSERAGKSGQGRGAF